VLELRVWRSVDFIESDSEELRGGASDEREGESEATTGGLC
jgi:hypothetical protein